VHDGALREVCVEVHGLPAMVLEVETFSPSDEIAMGRGLRLPALGPGQRDFRHVHAPPFKDAARSVYGQFDNCPISVQLDESAAIDGPQETGTAKIGEGATASATEQGPGIPAQMSGALCPFFTGGQEIVTVGQKLAPSVRRDISQWATVVEARNPLAPTGRNATYRQVGRLGVIDRSGSGLHNWQGRLSLQAPAPFTPIPKTVPNGSYSEKLLGLFEHLRMGDALAFAKQSSGSGHHLELGHI
jgi:hypothetical protein